MPFLRAILFAIMVFAAPAAIAQETLPTAPWVPTRGPYQEATTRAVFPAVLGDRFLLTSTRNLETERKGAGLSIRYESSHRSWVDVTVFNLGRTDIPEGIRDESGGVSPLILDVFANVKEAMRTVERAGRYRNLTIKPPSIVGTPADHPYQAVVATARYTLIEPWNEVDMVAFVAMFGYRGQLLQIRYSERHQAYEQNQGAHLAAFFEALMAELKAAPR